MTTGGCEWVIDAFDCDPKSLADQDRLRRLFDSLVETLSLHPIGESRWHQFPSRSGVAPGGITGMTLLAESHIACHTFPEHGSMCLNVFCCRARPDGDFARLLKQEFQAGEVRVKRIDRPYQR